MDGLEAIPRRLDGGGSKACQELESATFEIDGRTLRCEPVQGDPALPRACEVTAALTRLRRRRFEPVKRPEI